MSTSNLRTLVGTPATKIGTFLFEFTTPGIGQILKAAGADYAVLDMPDTLSKDALDLMAGIRVAGQALRISIDGQVAPWFIDNTALRFVASGWQVLGLAVDQPIVSFA